jgi:hypothetical protein
MHFAPKGEDANDCLDVVRALDAVRLLSLTNTDNKIICGVFNAKITVTIARGACLVQRGFIVCRNFVDNIVDLDAYGRAYAMNRANYFPILARLNMARPSRA